MAQDSDSYVRAISTVETGCSVWYDKFWEIVTREIYFFYFILLVVYKYIINGIFKIIVGGQMNVLETLDLE